MAQTTILFDHGQQAPRGVVFRIQLERQLQFLLGAIELTNEGQRQTQVGPMNRIARQQQHRLFQRLNRGLVLAGAEIFDAQYGLDPGRRLRMLGQRLRELLDRRKMIPRLSGPLRLVDHIARLRRERMPQQVRRDSPRSGSFITRNRLILQGRGVLRRRYGSSQQSQARKHPTHDHLHTHFGTGVHFLHNYETPAAFGHGGAGAFPDA